MDSVAQHVLDALYARRSIRVYRPEPVAQEQLETLLKAAMAAPSACNIQPWAFIVVTAPEALARVKAAIPENGDYNAPAAIVVCGYPELIPWEGDNGLADAAAAIENILTAATALGLGTVWIGGFEADRLREALDIPPEVVPLGVVYVGHPAEAKEPRTQYLDEAVFWQKYDPARPVRPRPGCLVWPKGYTPPADER